MRFSTLVMAILLATTTTFAQSRSERIIKISTEMGDITCKLYNETPLHRDNFLELAKNGSYDGSIFHRVIKDFMIQGGGNAAMQTIDGRPQIPAEILPQFVHKKGALAAARTGDNVNPERMSSGSQFYIVQGRKTPSTQLDMMAQRSGMVYTDEHKKAYAELGGTPHLDGAYTVFGEVIEGLEVVDKIAAVQTAKGNKPVSDIKMTVTVVK